MNNRLRPHRQQRSWFRWTNPFRHSSLDNAQLALLGFLLAFAVFAFGGTEAWSQLVVVLLSSLLMLFVALRPLIDREFQLRPNWIWLPLAVLVLLAVVQLIPLPASLVRVLSPARVSAYEAMDAVATPVPNLLPLSAAPLLTAQSLRLVLVALFVLVAAVSYLQTREHVEKLLTVVFGIGCGEALLAILQIATKANKLYWTVDPGTAGMMSAGSFVNHSHFAQFTNLAIGAGIGLLLIRLERDQSKSRLRNGEWQVDSADMLQRQGWLLAGLSVCVLAVCLSLSRNGILSLSIAAAVAGGLLSANRQFSWRGWVIALVPVLAFVLLLLFGLDSFYDRLGTLEQGDSFADRWNLTTDSLEAGRHYPVFGSGLGTYSLVFPEYDTTRSVAVAVYADNDYAQLFVEAGLIGWGVVAIGALQLALLAYRAMKSHRSSASQAAYGLVIGLAAVAIHSITDFGQRLPAVFMLTAMLAGALAVLHRIGRRSGSSSHAGDETTQPTASRWASSLAAAVLVAAVSMWMLAGAYGHYQAESWWALSQVTQHRLENRRWAGSEQDYQELLLATENALAWEPADVVMRYWLNQYRWQAIMNVPTELQDPEELRVAIRPLAGQIAEQLESLRSECPTYHLPYLLEGRLRGYLLDDDKAASALFARGADLAPSDPEAQFAYGAWAAHLGQLEIAVQHLTQAVTIDPARFTDAAETLIVDLDAVEEARKLAGADVDRLKSLLPIVQAQSRFAEVAGQLKAEIDQRLTQLAEQGVASSGQLAALAQVAANSGDHQRAVELYRRALSSDYNQFAWRMGLARSLRAAGEFNAARREIRICVRLRPNDRQARELSDALALEVDQEHAPHAQDAGPSVDSPHVDLPESKIEPPTNSPI